MSRWNGEGETWPKPIRGIAALVICCVVVVSAIAVGRTGRTRKAVAVVQAALDQGEYAEAFTLAQSAAVADRAAARPLVDVLVAWADKQGRADVAAVYLAAAGVDPTAPGPYIGLAKLFATYSTWQMSIEGRQQMVGFWMKGAAASKALARNATAVAAAASLAAAAEDYATAAGLLPNDGDAQLRAGISYLLRNDTASALPYVTKARELLGERADVQMALAVGGRLDPVPVETVVDVKTSISSGAVIGVNATHAFVLESFGTRCRIVRVSFANGSTEPIVPVCGQGAALSPDGERLAYTTLSSWQGSCTVRLISIDDRQEHDLVRTMAGVMDIDWSADGQKLSIAALGGLIVVDADGGDRRLVVASQNPGKESGEWPVSARFSPDGQRLAYVTGYYESSGPIAVVSLADGTSVAVDSHDVTGGDWLGDQLVYGTGGGGLRYHDVVYVKDWAAPAAVARPLTPDMVEARLVAVSPGRGQVLLRMLLRTPAKSGEQQRLWVCDIDSGRVGLLPIRDLESIGPYWAAEGTTHYWAADGTIYYCSGARLVGIRVK